MAVLVKYLMSLEIFSNPVNNLSQKYQLFFKIVFLPFLSLIFIHRYSYSDLSRRDRYIFISVALISRCDHQEPFNTLYIFKYYSAAHKIFKIPLQIHVITKTYMVQYFIWCLMSIFVIWKKGSEIKNLKERGNFFFKRCQSEDVDIKQQNADSSGSGPEAEDVILVKKKERK